MYRNPIKEWLAANEKPQTWLAEQVGVTRQSVYAWCKGVARPDVDRAHQIAQLTGLSLEELLDPRVVGREIRAARPHQVEAT